MAPRISHSYTSKVEQQPPYRDFIPVGEQAYFRRTASLPISPPLPLDGALVAVSPYGGPVAITRDARKPRVLQPGMSARPRLDVFSQGGGKLLSVPWEGGQIVALGWTENEDIVVIAADGTLLLLSLDGEPKSRHVLVRDTTIVSAVVYPAGIVALTATNSFVAFDWRRPAPRTLAAVPRAPAAWSVLPPAQSPSNEVEVFAAVDKTIFTITEAAVRDQLLSTGPFSSLSSSPNGKLLAAATLSKLFVYSSDFQKNFGEFSLDITAPDQIAWCGSKAVLLANTLGDVMIAAIGGGSTVLELGTPLVLSPEPNGTRILTSTRSELIHKLPPATESVFSLGSTSPAAILYDALVDYENRRPEADEKLRLVRPDLTSALDTLLDAALIEFTPERQMALLKSASLGKCFINTYNHEKFVDACKVLKVLNAVRKVGVPITYGEYLFLTGDGLVKRLVGRKEYFLALKVCETLGLPGEKVVSSWAREKMKAGADNEVLERLVQVRGRYPELSFAEIAGWARGMGKNELAVKLLDLEVVPSNQVFPLLSMKEYALALEKAVQSGDTDLAYSALITIRREVPTAEFFRMLRGSPQGAKLFEVYCREKDVQLLRDFYYQDDRRVDGARLVVKEALETESPAEKIAKLRTALKLYSEDKDAAFEARATEDQIRLLQLQVALEKELKKTILGKSVADTILELIALGDLARATKVKNDYRVSDKLFAWIRLRGLIMGKQWAELRTLAKGRSPIGFAPYVTLLLDAGEPREAAVFVDRVEPTDRRQLLQRRINEGLHPPRPQTSTAR